jgi:hypothetical protein
VRTSLLEGVMKAVFSFLIALFLFLSLGNLHAAPQLECKKKWIEVKYKGKRVKRYELKASDFPEDRRFRLVVKWFNGEEAETYSYISNRHGHLFLDEESNGDPIYALCPLKKGERISFLMRAEDDPSFSVEASVVPFPLTFKTKSGLKLSVELMGQDGEAFRLLGRKFRAEEQFELKSSFQGKERGYSVTASSQGKINVPFILEMEDREGGECVLTLKRGLEEAVITFQAGQSALGLAGGFALQIR